MSNFTVNIEKQFSKLGKDIQQFVEKVVPLQTEEGHFTPACDIIEGKDQYIIKIDLPGLNKKEVSLSLKDRVITIRGEREMVLEEEQILKRNERKQGMFSRSFAVPGYVDPSSVSATFKDGVLSVKLSKTGVDNEEDSTSIPIK